MPSTTVEIRGKDKTKTAFSSVSNSLRSMKSAVGSLQGAVLGLIGIGGLGAMVTKLADTADRLGKTSDRLGIATDDLQKLRFSAQKSGVAVSTFDMALQRFTRRVSEVGQGTGVAKEAFEEMGISVRNNDGTLKSNTVLLKEVADVLKVTENQSDRVRLAFKLFDSEGVKVVNMLQQGSSAIERTGEQLESVSGIIDDKAIDAFEKFNDRLTIMTSAATGLLAKVVELMVKGFDPFFEDIEKKELPLTEQLGYLVKKIADLKKELAEAKIPVKEVTTSFFGAKETTEVLIGVNEDLIKTLETELKVYYEEATAIQIKINKQKEEEQQTKLQIAEAKRLKEAMDQLVNVTQDSTNVWHNYYQARDAQLQDEATAFQESLQKKLQAESDYLDQRIIANMEMSQAHRAMLQQEELEAEAKAQRDKERTKDVAMSSLSTIQSLSAGVANETQGLFELNKAVSIANVVINASEASTKALAQLGAFGPPVAGAIYALAIANVAKIASQKYPGREYGGDVIANKPYIVGEAGPEVFTPGRTGTITPNDQLGNQTNVNFSINAVDTRNFDQLLVARRGLIIGMINKAMNRNGQQALV
tara:strand:- start:1250 stop:3016 length:1767 start_codon:yes stop_codon:yes gene_type:complete